MTTAGEFCNRTVYIAERGDSILEAARLMREHHVGDVVVVETVNDRRVPVGILTDRDIAVGIVAVVPERLESLTVGEVVTESLVTAREQERLEDVMKRMRSFGVRRMPVIDNDDTLIGILAFDDIIEFLAEQLSDLAQILVRERQHEHAHRASSG